MFHLIEWIWSSCLRSDAILITALAVLVFVYIFWAAVCIIASCRDRISGRACRTMERLTEKIECWHDSVIDELDDLPDGWDWADRELFEESKLDNNKKGNRRNGN